MQLGEAEGERREHLEGNPRKGGSAAGFRRERGGKQEHFGRVAARARAPRTGAGVGFDHPRGADQADNIGRRGDSVYGLDDQERSVGEAAEEIRADFACKGGLVDGADFLAVPGLEGVAQGLFEADEGGLPAAGFSHRVSITVRTI